MKTKQEDHAVRNAKSWMQEIRRMTEALNDEGGSKEHDEITESILSVEIRSAWYAPGTHEPGTEAAEYKILLTTGGPALRIIGDLGTFNEPENARLEYQDWGTPWTELSLSSEDHDALVTFACVFYFGQ